MVENGRKWVEMAEGAGEWLNIFGNEQILSEMSKSGQRIGKN